jgi:membrane-bound lytic murein transglycosylase MltF
MENSAALKQLIRKNAHLFWYTKDSEKENLPLAVVLEFFLNYADKEQIKKLFQVVGIENAAAEFFKQINLMGNRSNYLPQFQNYFSLYFKKYALQYSK